ncbi:MAG: hypothetical protein AB1705_02730 [Verrucomicrobiota bacterium]
MNTAPDEFEKLRKLLALKRHEQPPPRYFSEFSEKVRLRVETEAAPKESLWERLAATLNIQPLTAAAYGAAVCAIMVVGVKLAYQTGTETAGQPDTLVATPQMQPVDPLVPNQGLAGQPVSATTETNPPPGLFSPVITPETKAEPVKFETK